MRTFVAVVFVPLALLLLASCATLSEEECRAADWYQIGVNDGAEGRATDYVESHRRACAGVGVSPDVEAWLRGRAQGLRLYCTPAKAYQVAREGHALRPGCTAEEIQRLQPAYDWGREYWRLEIRIEDVRSDIRAVDRELAALPPDSARRGMLYARRSMLVSRLHLYELQQRRYATWP
jgi:hypothetical protein